MYIYYILIFFLATICCVFYAFEIHPYLVNKVSRKYYMFSKKTKKIDYLKQVYNRAINISKHEVPKMSLADNTYFPIVFVRELSLKLRGNNRLKNSFPRAFLLNGIIDYALSINDKKTIEILDKKVFKYVSETLKNIKSIDYIDKVSMGMVVLKLYKENNNEDYKKLCDLIIDYLLDSVDENHNIVLYRKNQGYHYVDVLGMICPFILMYAKEFDRTDLIDFSNKQVKYYIENGLSISNFPYHAIELSNKMPLGSSNWGRGMGWYMLGLSAILKYSNEQNNPEYKFFDEKMKELVVILKTLKQKNHYWGQFLGLSKKWHLDTSVTVMLIYSMSLVNYFEDFNDFFNFIKPLTKKNGAVDYTSGDTEDINVYSREYGESELTQGILLSIFSIENKPKQ